MSPETTQTRPGEPPRAWCPQCRRDGIRTYEEGGVTKYRTHDHVEGGEDSPPCLLSGLPVTDEPLRGAR